MNAGYQIGTIYALCVVAALTWLRGPPSMGTLVAATVAISLWSVVDWLLRRPKVLRGNCSHCGASWTIASPEEAERRDFGLRILALHGKGKCHVPTAETR